MAKFEIGSAQGCCGNCGSEELEFDDSFEPETAIKCPKCGSDLGTYGDFIAQTEATLADAIKKLLGF